MNSATQKISLQGGAGPIEALLDAPTGAPRGTVVIAHPHPLFGGTMTNKVVQTLARAFVQTGWRAVRFNFRGVGASAGVYDEGRGEAADMLEVVRQVAPEGPLAVAGFSFGAFVTSHVVTQLAPRQPEKSCWSVRPPRVSPWPQLPRSCTSAPWFCMASRTTPWSCPV